MYLIRITTVLKYLTILLSIFQVWRWERELYNDNIFILDLSNPCLYLYNKDLVLQKSVVLEEEEEDNKFGNVLISDYNSILLNPEFEFIHKISVSSPFGITMDWEDIIIVVCNTASNCLQIFWCYLT